VKDLKAALNSGVKPDLTHCRKSGMVYAARANEYGSDKYERANYLRPADGDPFDVRANFERYRGYLRATLSHVVETLDAMELHQAGDPLLEDVDGMRAAAYAPDTDATPGAKVGASFLPHVAHAIASLTMAIEQATRFGLTPKDPGQPWKRDASAPGFVDSLSGKRHTVPKEWIRKQLGGTPESREIVDAAVVVAAKTPETIGAERVTRYGVDELVDAPPVALGGLDARCGDQRCGYTCELPPHADDHHRGTDPYDHRIVRWRDRSGD